MQAATALLLTGLLLASIARAHPGSGIAVDAEGRVFFAAGSMITRIDPDGTAHTIVNDRANEKFYQLHHIQRAPDGGLLTASDLGDVIWRFTPEGKLTHFYPPANEDRALRVGVGGDPFAVDRRGNIYAVNSVQDRFTQILRIAPEGRIEVLAGGDWGYADGAGTKARFADLHGGSLLVAPDGALLLTESGARIRQIAQDGTVTTLAGGETRGSEDGPGKDARFDGASGLALDAKGNLLVVESVGRIRKISPEGMVTTVAGSAAHGGADGPLREATFDDPTGIAIGSNGDIFILEPHRSRVRKIANGRVTTIHQGLPAEAGQRRPQ